MRKDRIRLAAIWLAIPLLLAAGEPPKPATVAGSLLTEKGDIAKIAPALGDAGVLLISSQARWDQLMKRIPDLAPKTSLPKVDFGKQSVVMLYATPRRTADFFSLDKSDLAASPPQLDFTLHWDNTPREQDDRTASRYILAVIPASQSVKVALASDVIHANGAGKAAEFTATLGNKDGGDLVAGLQASIAAKAAAIHPGDDILIDFTLHAPKIADDNRGQMNISPGRLYAWDGKYSNGYRNHAFFVTAPDGTTTFLQPKEQRAWDKNAPHPVEVTADKPYQLPNWAEGSNFKSLKALGLDTSKPGTYTITGLYEETYNGAADIVQGGKGVIWAGSVASNTIKVEVAK